MTSRTIEARLVITSQDKASANVGAVVKATKDAVKAFGEMQKAGKASAEVQKLNAALERTAKAARDVEQLQKTRATVASADMAFRQARANVTAVATALDMARKAAKQYEGVKVGQATAEQAAKAAEAARAVKDLTAQHKSAQATLRATTAALQSHTRAMESARTAVNAYGVPFRTLEAHQRSLKGSIEATTRAIRDQGKAEEEAAAKAAKAAKLQAQNDAIRQNRKDAAKALAFGAGIYAGHKAGEARKEVMHTYAEFDDLIRYQSAVADLSKAERKSRVSQALHLGGSTGFNDIQVAEAQLTLAQRGVKKEFVEPFVGEIVNYAQAMKTDLPSAAKTLEGVIFSTNQNVEDASTALTVMRRNVDMLVKTAKIGGLNNEDLAHAFKFAGASGSGAGLSNTTLGSIFATLHRAGFAGSEAGVAARALASRLVAPTQKGLAALATMGIDYSKFTKVPGGLSAEAVAGKVRQDFGKELSGDQKTRIQEAIDNQTFVNSEGQDTSIVADRGQFTAALADIVAESFGTDKKGKTRASDMQAITKKIGEFHKFSIESVDSEGLLRAILEKDPTLGQANAFASDKHGGKLIAMAKKLETFKEMTEALQHVPEGFAKGIGDARMGGFAGAMKRLEGTRLNMETAAGRALDNDGEDHGGVLTSFVNAIANVQQHLAEMDPKLVAAGSAAVYFGGKLTEAAGTLGLMGSAIALTKSAYALDAAAIKLAGGKVGDVPGGAPSKGGASKLPAIVGALGPVAATAAIGYLLSEYGDPKKAIAAGGTPDAGVKLDPSDELPGVGAYEDAPKKAEALGQEIGKKIVKGVEAGVKTPTLTPGDELPGIPSDLAVKAESKGKEAGEKAGTGIGDGIRAKSPEVIEQGQSLYDRLKELFSQGIRIPISLAPGDGIDGAGSGAGIRNVAYDPDRDGNPFRPGGANGRNAFGGTLMPGDALDGSIRRGAGGRRRVPSERGVPDAGSAQRGSGAITGPLRGGPTDGVRAEVRAYVRAAAAARGIDPNVAERVVNQESGFNPHARNINPRERSFGVMQLNTMGGLGAVARRQGIEPSDPSQWRRHIDFSLDVVKRDGWRQWYGARDVGIKRWQGIGGTPTVALPEIAVKGSDSAEYRAFRAEQERLAKTGQLPDEADDDAAAFARWKKNRPAGGGRIKLPNGTIRSGGLSPRQPYNGPPIPEAPEGGFGGGFGARGSGDFQSAADRMHAAAERMERMSVATHHTFEVTGSGRDSLRAKGMRATSSGPIQADVGISMPHTKVSDYA